jgi:hypothetical protein
MVTVNGSESSPGDAARATLDAELTSRLTANMGTIGASLPLLVDTALDRHEQEG